MKVDKQKLENILEKEEIIILSTSKDNCVQSRPISLANNGLDVYIKTSNDSRKAIQMQANSNVALCIDDYYIEGQAKFLGSPSDPKNSDVKSAYIKKYPDAFGDDDEYASDSDVFIAITMTKIHQWIFENGAPIGLAVEEF